MLTWASYFRATCLLHLKYQHSVYRESTDYVGVFDGIAELAGRTRDACLRRGYVSCLKAS
jgi:hypothetical protein